MTGNVALWTTGATTIVLPNVTSAYWLKQEEEPPAVEGMLVSCGSPRWRRVHIEEATRFVVNLGDDEQYFDGSDFKDTGISFPRALSLYWETRS